MKFIRGIWPLPQGLPDAPTAVSVSWKSLMTKGGVGKFQGEGGFCGTLPPLQGQFVKQLASTAAKVVKDTTSKLESQALLRQKGPPDSHSEHMHLQFCRTRGL